MPGPPASFIARDLVGFDEQQIELHVVLDERVEGQDRERLAVLRAGMRMVRSFWARPTACAQAWNAVSTARLMPGSSASIWSRGPVPTVSLASVSTMPRA